MTIDVNMMNTIGIAGTVFGLFGIIISIYFYKKQKKVKRLSVKSESTILISETLNKYKNLKISYNNQNITSLTSTIIKITNIGTDIVEPTDLAPSSPLIIKTTDKFLLDDITQYKITTSNSKNLASLSKISDTSLQISFDFLNPKEYIIITLLHTGDISVDGDLKTNSIKNYIKLKDEQESIAFDDEVYKSTFSYMGKVLETLFVLTSMLIAMFTILFKDFYPSDYQLASNDSLVIVLIFFAFILLIKNKK